MKTNAYETRAIPVTIDKSHLITIGEKLYTEKTSFIRELVNNAYDADATEVYVEMADNAVTIRDNGSGMDERGLRQYFTIGSSLKKTESKSHRFGRSRIGEFGIGKFAALSACKRFLVETEHEGFRARLLFDKEIWSRHEDWHVDIDILPPENHTGNGTTIKLEELNVDFSPARVRKYLAERTPINAPHFAVFLNGDRVTDDVITGRHIPLRLVTPYGIAEGNLTILPSNSRASGLGVGILVKSILVRYEQFGLDTSRKFGVGRITGRINADFLPITSSRDDFIRDSAIFISFYDAVKKEIGKAIELVREDGDQKVNIQASRVLKDALHKIGKAMKRCGDIFPETQIAFGAPSGQSVSGADTHSKSPENEIQSGFEISGSRFLPTHEELPPDLQARLANQKNMKRGKRLMGMLGNKSVVRTLKVANMELAVRLEHLGKDEESVVSGGVIYVNIDHPLYRTYRENDELLTTHLARVLTKELALRAGAKDAEQAFALQASLLVNALKEKGT
ncbi:MAG: ATP-binding protein [Candidatus Taylorbacteria bacterium]|nr:ATP-binding protein [Candidatus Taylorbacteria bacterium]